MADRKRGERGNRCFRIGQRPANISQSHPIEAREAKIGKSTKCKAGNQTPAGKPVNRLQDLVKGIPVEDLVEQVGRKQQAEHEKNIEKDAPCRHEGSVRLMSLSLGTKLGQTGSG